MKRKRNLDSNLLEVQQVVNFRPIRYRLSKKLNGKLTCEYYWKFVELN